jgi:tRNA splicing ligase
MKFFYLSSKSNSSGKFEIHEKDCIDIPEAIVRDYLGPFNNGREALRKALISEKLAVCCEKCCKTSFEASFIQVRSKEN